MAAPRVRTCAPVGLGLALASLEVVAAPLATRQYGNAMGDGLGDGLTFSAGDPTPLSAKVCAAGETLFGIDVSYYQGDIDWSAVAADGVIFAYVRVSHAPQFDDPKFQQNLAGARAAGIHTGVIRCGSPTITPAAR